MTTISRSRPSERHKPRNQPAPAARFVVRRHWPFHRRVPFRRGWSWHLLSSDHPNDLVFDYSGACRRPGWALTWVWAVAGLTRQAKRRHARRPESSDALRVVVEMQAGAVAGHGKAPPPPSSKPPRRWEQRGVGGRSAKTTGMAVSGTETCGTWTRPPEDGPRPEAWPSLPAARRAGIAASTGRSSRCDQARRSPEGSSRHLAPIGGWRPPRADAAALRQPPGARRPRQAVRRPLIAGIDYEQIDWLVKPRSGRPGWGSTAAGSLRWDRAVRKPLPPRRRD